MKGQSH